MVIVNVSLSRQENMKVRQIAALKNLNSKEKVMKYLVGVYEFNDRAFVGETYENE